MLAVLTLASILVVASSSESRAATPEKVVGRPGAGEFQPVRGDNFLAWQQNTRRNPNDYNVYARELGGGGGTFRVNPRRVNAANGDIDGDVLVYQQFKAGDSKLKLFDLATTGGAVGAFRGLPCVGRMLSAIVIWSPGTLQRGIDSAVRWVAIGSKRRGTPRSRSLTTPLILRYGYGLGRGVPG